MIPIHLHTHTHTIGHLPGDPRPDRTVAPPPQLTPTRHAAASKERFPIVPIVGERPSASQEGPPVSGSPFGPLVHLSQPPAVRPSSPMPRPPTTNLTSQIDSPCQKTPSSTPLEGRTDDFRGVDFRMEDATTFPSQFSAVRPSSPTPRPPTANLTSQIDLACQKPPVRLLSRLELMIFEGSIFDSKMLQHPLTSFQQYVPVRLRPDFRRPI